MNAIATTAKTSVDVTFCDRPWTCALGEVVMRRIGNTYAAYLVASGEVVYSTTDALAAYAWSRFPAGASSLR